MRIAAAAVLAVVVAVALFLAIDRPRDGARRFVETREGEETAVTIQR